MIRDLRAGSVSVKIFQRHKLWSFRVRSTVGHIRQVKNQSFLKCSLGQPIEKCGGTWHEPILTRISAIERARERWTRIWSVYAQFFKVRKSTDLILQKAQNVFLWNVGLRLNRCRGLLQDLSGRNFCCLPDWIGSADIAKSHLRLHHNLTHTVQNFF